MSLAAFERARERGAVGFVSKLIRQAVSPFQIVNDIRRAYPGMAPSEYGAIYQLGVGAYSAGQEVTGIGGSGIAPLEQIPVNPGLWKGEATGNRFRFQTLVEYQIPGEPSTRFSTLNINTLQNYSQAELLAKATDLFDQLVNRRSPKMPSYMPGPPIVVDITVIDLERQF